MVGFSYFNEVDTKIGQCVIIKKVESGSKDILNDVKIVCRDNSLVGVYKSLRDFSILNGNIYSLIHSGKDPVYNNLIKVVVNNGKRTLTEEEYLTVFQKLKGYAETL